jgi:Capsule assembly protein Wzi
MPRYLFLFLVVFFLKGNTPFVWGQSSSQTRLFAEAHAYGSTSLAVPFWLRSNQFGVVPDRGKALGLTMGARQDSMKLFGNPAWQWRYAFEATVLTGTESALVIPEAFLQLRYKAFNLTVGRRREVMGLGDSTLTSGGFWWSGNALPMPKIVFETRDYVPLLFDGAISGKFYMAHGWFGQESRTQEVLLHQKYLYLRLGKPSSKIKFYGGLTHQVQWGGRSALWTRNQAFNGQLPSDLATFFRVVLPQKGFGNPDTSRTNSSDFYYVGNHNGSVDMGMEWQINNVQLFLYKQTPYETGALFTGLTTFDDGLYGIRLKLPSPKVRTVLFEMFDTRNQGIYESFLAKVIGQPYRHPGEYEDYYNHSQYMDGWAYHGRGLGSPLVWPSTEFLSERTPRINYSVNNRVIAWHVGVQGQIHKIDYRFRGTYGVHEVGYGYRKNDEFRALFPVPRSQYSFLLELEKKMDWLEGTWLKVGLGYDSGTISTSQLGTRISVRKSW